MTTPFVSAMSVPVVLAGLGSMTAGMCGAAQPPQSQDLSATVAGNTEFALNLDARIRREVGNRFLSPYCISSALAMTYGGAAGETAKQMAGAMHFSQPSERLHVAFRELRECLQLDAAKSRVVMHTANAVWVHDKTRLLDSFLALSQDNYAAAARTLSFERDPEAARRTINAWVDDQTKGKIRDLLGQASVSKDTGVVLTSAVYFKGRWSSPFDAAQTKSEPFQCAKNFHPLARTMHHTGDFPYAKYEDVALLELPYEGDRLSLVVILPAAVDGIAAVEGTLDRKRLAEWLGGLRRETVRLAMPQFRIEDRFDLSQALTAMGMRDAFAKNADFSAMSTGKPLYLSLVVHHAFVDVNEEGTEAAAATGVLAELGYAGHAEPVAFVADHPFIFLIRDMRSGSVLFLGRVVNPNGN